jgi:hypothetical protein
MTRIRIKDLPKGLKVTQEELETVRGGLTIIASYTPALSPIRYVQPTPLVPVVWSPRYNSSGCFCGGMGQDPKTVLP